MSKAIITEEWARKPQAEVKIACEECKNTYTIRDFLREEQFPTPHENFFQVLWVCPSCGHRKHAYYESGALRLLQKELKIRLGVWNRSHESHDFYRYLNTQKHYQEEFDKIQIKAPALLGQYRHALETIREREDQSG